MSSVPEEQPKTQRTPKNVKTQETPKTPKTKTPKTSKTLKTPKQKNVKNTESKPRVRRVISKDSIKKGFEELQQQIEKEIDSGHDKKVGVKFLKNLNKKLKLLFRDTERVMKLKPKNNNNKNKNSAGFYKPVKISEELAEFAGWKVDEPHSRIDVTRLLCNYVKNNKLENTTFKRWILPDEKLSKLLRYDSKVPPINPKTGKVIVDKSTGEPIKHLGYCNLQQLVQIHFVKDKPID